MTEKAKTEGDIQTVDERDLFHGTDSLDTCRKICTNSFDFRISGKNASRYGEGSYFALQSEYSNRYTNKNEPSRLMFRAKVLVGKYTEGEMSFKRPPEIPGGNLKLYDSCVNDVRNPTIFVIFDTHQCYPEYLIQYQKLKQEDAPEGPLGHNAVSQGVPSQSLTETPSQTAAVGNMAAVTKEHSSDFISFVSQKSDDNKVNLTEGRVDPDAKQYVSGKDVIAALRRKTNEACSIQ